VNETKRKEMVTRFKKLPRELEKIFASYTSDKGIIRIKYREPKNLYPPKSMTQ
jgi:hypothetical protein